MFKKIAMAIASLYMLSIGIFLFPYATAADGKLISLSIVAAGALGLVALCLEEAWT